VLGHRAPLTVDVEPLGRGAGLLSTLHRVQLHAGGDDGVPETVPETVVVKQAPTGERSRTVGIDLGMYRNEVLFYRRLAGATPLAIGCRYAAMDEATGDFVLVLEDMTGCDTIDQIAGCPPDRAAAVVAALADHHAAFWGGAGLAGHCWLRRLDDDTLTSALARAFAAAWPAIRDRHHAVLPPGVVDLGDRFPAHLPAVAAELAAGPATLSHGDVRLDNMFFAPAAPAGDAAGVTLCDWQMVDRSRGCRDLAYFVSQSLRPDDRAEHEGALLADYRRRLAARGVDYPATQAWRDYRLGTLFALLYPVIAGAGLDLDDRATRLTEVILTRSATAIDELDCVALAMPHAAGE